MLEDDKDLRVLILMRSNYDDAVKFTLGCNLVYFAGALSKSA